MARGQGCTDNPSEADSCAYAARLVSKLRETFPQARLLFENRAVGGMTTGGSLLSLPTLSSPVTSEDGGAPDASMLLIDFAINDSFEAQTVWSGERKMRELQTYMRVKDHLKGRETGDQVHRSVLAASEAMVRYLLEHRSRTAVLVVEGTCWKSPSRRTHEAHRRVARYYGVPHFDFTDALRNGIASQYTVWEAAGGGIGPDACAACIRRGKQCEHSTFPVLFSDGKHPDGRGHQLVADALAMLLHAWWHDAQLLRAARQLQRMQRKEHTQQEHTPMHPRSLALLPPPFSDPPLLAQHAICATPTTLHSSATPPPHPNVTAADGGWRLYEDRPGKPAWVSTGPNGSVIEFGVAFGPSPRLTLMWTLGYEGFASVAVTFDSAKNRHRRKIIDGMRTDGLRATQAAVLDMDVGHMHHGSRLDLSYGVAGWAIKPYAHERFRVEMLCRKQADAITTAGSCGKFKILAVRAC